VRFQVLTAASMKMTVFWVVAPCSLVEVYWCFRSACYLNHQGDCPDDGVNKHLWNVGILLPDYMVLQPRRQSSSPPSQFPTYTEMLYRNYSASIWAMHMHTRLFVTCGSCWHGGICCSLLSGTAGTRPPLNSFVWWGSPQQVMTHDIFPKNIWNLITVFTSVCLKVICILSRSIAQNHVSTNNTTLSATYKEEFTHLKLLHAGACPNYITTDKPVKYLNLVSCS
jgi:hypothetical protein